MNFRIPDFPLGGLFVVILISIGFLFAVPNLPYPWLWILAVVFGSTVWALGAGVCASIRPGDHIERPHEHDRTDHSKPGTPETANSTLIPKSAQSADLANGKDDTAEPKKGFWCCANRWFWRIANGLKTIDELITAVATVFLVLATVLLAMIAKWQYDALQSTDTTLHNTLVASTRAWVEPLTLSLNEPLKAGTDGHLTLIVDNSGREPAIKIGRYEEFGIVDMTTLPEFRLNNEVSSPKPFDQAVLALGFSDSCEIAKRNRYGGVFYPNRGNIGSGTNQIDVPSKYVTNEIANSSGIATLVVNGCYVYDTMGATHETRYCYFYNKALSAMRPKRTDSGDFLLCLTGNDPD